MDSCKKSRKRAIKARSLAFGGAVLAGVLVLLPIPIMDLLMMIPVQFLITFGVLAVTRQTMERQWLVALVLGYGLVGAAVGLGLEIFIPLLGKLLLAPFAFVWCYLLGELAMILGNDKK